MADSNRLGRLSCTRCKERKVRCNRVMPRCDRCESCGVECVYPERVKRRTRRLVPERSQSTKDNHGFNAILERLHHLEQQRVIQTLMSTSCSPAASSSLSSQTSPKPPSVPFPTPSSPEFDATATLKDAMEQVQKLKMQDYARSVITERIEFPPELAKKWIHNYFTHMPTDMFLSLVNKRLIELIPEIIGLPHVHLDPAIVVLYYGILYHGCTLHASNVPPERGADYSKSCYIGCLRGLAGWQREATGSTTDFIAAVVMVRVAAECFDFDLSWKMFTQACEYAQGLELHNLDGEDKDGGNYRIKSDHDRRGFWQLVQNDLYFRLILNKPPAITAKAWKVNLPWMNVDAQPPPVQALAFLVSSRLTMVFISFFVLLGDKKIALQELRLKTEDLCREIRQTFVEWRVEGWFTVMHNKEDNYLVLDALLTGYTCIIFMLRKLDVLESTSHRLMERDADLPNSPLALDAAREIVKILTQAISVHPSPETLSNFLGAYESYIPTAYLYCKVLDSDNMEAHKADIQILEQFSSYVSTVARGSSEFRPLVRALGALNGAIQRKVVNATG